MFGDVRRQANYRVDIKNIVTALRRDFTDFGSRVLSVSFSLSDKTISLSLTESDDFIVADFLELLVESRQELAPERLYFFLFYVNEDDRKNDAQHIFSGLSLTYHRVDFNYAESQPLTHQLVLAFEEHEFKRD